jgi:hypothetical protein
MGVYFPILGCFLSFNLLFILDPAVIVSDQGPTGIRIFWFVSGFGAKQ